jgi:hypothetical protein
MEIVEAASRLHEIRMPRMSDRLSSVISARPSVEPVVKETDVAGLLSMRKLPEHPGLAFPDTSTETAVQSWPYAAGDKAVPVPNMAKTRIDISNRNVGMYDLLYDGVVSAAVDCSIYFIIHVIPSCFPNCRWTR